jgi:hypothetical protein
LVAEVQRISEGAIANAARRSTDTSNPHGMDRESTAAPWLQMLTIIHTVVAVVAVVAVVTVGMVTISVRAPDGA